MKLLFVGKTNFTYNRDLILLNGLKRREDVEIDVIQIKKRNWVTFREIRKRSKNCDFVVVPSFRHKDVTYVKWASKTPVVFDPLISKYMTKVLDYEERWKGPHKNLVDWLAFYWPDILIWDTISHMEYLRRKYNLKKPMAPIYIGVDTSLFYPLPHAENDKIIVGFYGSFNPLQGIDKIVEAAHILRDMPSIQFKIIGQGSTYKKVKSLADQLQTKNIEFIPSVPFDQLNSEVNKFDICLGVFGESKKTDVVIPNKIFHYAAARKCIITKDTAAIKEIFTHNQHMCLVKNDPKMLAETIVNLSKDRLRREQYAESAYLLVRDNYNQDKIAEDFVNFLRTCS